MSFARVVRDLLFRFLLEGSDDGDGEPGGGPPPGSPPTGAQTTVFFSPAIHVADTTMLISTSQIRRPLVHNPAGTLNQHRTVLFPGLLVLQDEVAAVIRSPDGTERQDSFQNPAVSAHQPPLGFSPHEAHAHQAFFGWILPTIRTSEFTILQIVGLDAAVVSGRPPPLCVEANSGSQISVVELLQDVVLLVFCLFNIRGGDPHANQLDGGCLVTTIDSGERSLNRQNNLGIGGDDDPDWIRTPNDTDHRNPPSSDRDWLDLLTDPTSIVSLQLVFTYLFTILTLFFVHKNYHKFIRSRQLFSLELVHSISARTVLVTRLPIHLRSERRLAEHFENMGLSVESVSVCRDVKSLEPLLAERTKALLKLEQAWVDYVGNPSTVESYDPSDFVAAPLVDIDSSGLESQHPRFVVPHHPRPTLRPGLFKGVADAIEYWDAQFHDADDEVKKRRQLGKFRATHSAFVTFEKMSSAVSCLFSTERLAIDFAPANRDSNRPRTAPK